MRILVLGWDDLETGKLERTCTSSGKKGLVVELIRPKDGSLGALLEAVETAKLVVVDLGHVGHQIHGSIGFAVGYAVARLKTVIGLRTAWISNMDSILKEAVYVVQSHTDLRASMKPSTPGPTARTSGTNDPAGSPTTGHPVQPAKNLGDEMTVKSVQPEWCRNLSLQQQSILLLASRGPDGFPKHHPAKVIQRAYRACILVAARIKGEKRTLKWGEKGDSFMTLHVFCNGDAWDKAVQEFFDAHDELPHHYLNHLMHGVQILGYKHPDKMIRERWNKLYRDMVDYEHLRPETEDTMDARLNDADAHE